MMYESLTMDENTYQSTVNLWRKKKILKKRKLFLQARVLQANKYEW